MDNFCKIIAFHCKKNGLCLVNFIFNNDLSIFQLQFLRKPKIFTNKKVIVFIIERQQFGISLKSNSLIKIFKNAKQ